MNIKERFVSLHLLGGITLILVGSTFFLFSLRPFNEEFVIKGASVMALGFIMALNGKFYSDKWKVFEIQKAAIT